MLVPIQFAVKYSPPRLCLIYETKGNQFFHDFVLTSADMFRSSDKIYMKLLKENPRYLDQVDQDQVISIIDKIKENQCQTPMHRRLNKSFNNQKSIEEFREMLKDEGITIESDTDSNNEYGEYEMF